MQRAKLRAGIAFGAVGIMVLGALIAWLSGDRKAAAIIGTQAALAFAIILSAQRRPRA